MKQIPSTSVLQLMQTMMLNTILALDAHVEKVNICLDVYWLHHHRPVSNHWSPQRSDPRSNMALHGQRWRRSCCYHVISVSTKGQLPSAVVPSARGWTCQGGWARSKHCACLTRARWIHELSVALLESRRQLTAGINVCLYRSGAPLATLSLHFYLPITGHKQPTHRTEPNNPFKLQDERLCSRLGEDDCCLTFPPS